MLWRSYLLDGYPGPLDSRTATYEANCVLWRALLFPELVPPCHQLDLILGRNSRDGLTSDSGV